MWTNGESTLIDSISTPNSWNVENNGYHFTHQKKLILETLLKSQIHLNVENINDILKQDKIGIATIYRGLNQFTELGITKELNINGTSFYELKIFGQKPLHIHFKCNECGDLIDIDNNEINLEYINLSNKIEEDNNIEITDTDILLRGICSKCKEKPSI